MECSVFSRNISVSAEEGLDQYARETRIIKDTYALHVVKQKVKVSPVLSRKDCFEQDNVLVPGQFSQVAYG